jgi:hypothetical protein
MSSTILSALGEAILHRNSLATITDNWIVVREVESHKQILVSIDSISQIKTFKAKAVKSYYLACALGCLLVAAATFFSKQPAGGAPLPFAVVGVTMLIICGVSRQASLGFVSASEIVQTAFGSLPEAATLVTAIHSTQQGNRSGEHPAYELFLWWRAYLTLLV